MTPHGEPPAWGYRDLALFAGAVVPSLLIASLAAAGLKAVFGESFGRAPSVLVMQVVSYSLWLAMLWLLIELKHGQPFWESLHWSGSVRAVAVCLGLGPVLALALAFCAHAAGAPQLDTFHDFVVSRVGRVVFALFVSTVAPLTEELIFRGFLMPVLMRTFGVVGGIALTAAPFALLHGPQYEWSVVFVAGIALAGIAFGWARYQTGSTAAATALHATYNLTLVMGVLLTEG